MPYFPNVKYFFFFFEVKIEIFLVEKELRLKERKKEKKFILERKFLSVNLSSILLFKTKRCLTCLSDLRTAASLFCHAPSRLDIPFERTVPAAYCRAEPISVHL